VQIAESIIKLSMPCIAGTCFSVLRARRDILDWGRTADNTSITSQGFLFRVNEWLGLLEPVARTILLSVVLSPGVVVLHGEAGEGWAVFVDGCFGEFEGE
jgi:hypothetical protein